jgi:hypothetical protein
MRAAAPGDILKPSQQLLSEDIMSTQTNVSHIVSLALRGVALAMGVAAVILGILKAASTETTVVLLGIGLFALALDALDQGKEA